MRAGRIQTAINALIGTALPLLAAIFFFYSASPAQAQVDQYHLGQDPNGGTAVVICADTGTTTGFIARVMPCLTGMIHDVSIKFFADIYPYFTTIINLAMLLAVLFFGTLLMFGMQKPQTEAFMFIIKFGSILLFTENLQMIYDWIAGVDGTSGILYQLIQIVSTYNVTGTALRCPITASTDIANVWTRIDCVINALIGINGGNTTNLLNGMIAFFMASFVSGVIGILIGLIGLYMCFNITIGMLRCCVLYLLSLMMVTLLLLVGLLFIPLLIFKMAGLKYFKQWLSILGGMILQPIVVFAFLNIMLVALDVTLFSGETSVFHTIAGTAADDPNFSINTYMQTNGLFKAAQPEAGKFDCSPRATSQPPADAYGPGYGPNGGNSPQATQPVAANDPCIVPINFEVNAIDFEKLAQIRNPAVVQGSASSLSQAMMMAIASSMLMAGLVSFLLVQLLNVMPVLAQDLAGGIKAVPDLAGSARLPGEAYIGKGVNQVAGRMQNMVTVRRSP